VGASVVHFEIMGQGAYIYTKTLMFAKSKDIPMGEYRFLTVVSPV
jgi:hypothetical protein